MASDAEKQTVRARFYKEAVLNEGKSKVEGRPIYDELELVEFFIPGDRNSRFVTEADERSSANGPSYAEMYPREYEAFKRNETRSATGTPLEQWPMVTASRCAELKAMNILSVDELATVSDAQVQRLGMGSRELREQARAFIALAKDGAGTASMAAEIAKLKAMVEALTARPPVAAQPEPVQATEKAIEDCTDEELKAFIKREAGEGMRGNPTRETLLDRARSLAEKAAA